ncbi:conjugal transfer protein TraF [Chromobacterium sp. IIBBL 290-4]|uniref:conjugal transfer protein TraF n=1 Tax=Chromobacterium sp. IIBBL 290-4 TaxID=2953890 RepID=UPI0020B7C618|nr:conjugal transfer protein TraF [Chromobacterium sp. IIBBL 290-4]UTH74231.1 conjugal transfer protein TraF [Chromobacterium sp. IIBBL 290-4]
MELRVKFPSRLVKPLAVLLGLALLGSARGGFFDRKAEGWYWYQDPKAKPVQAAPAATQPPIAPAIQDTQETAASAKTSPKVDDVSVPFSVKWFQKNLDELREIAINEPSEENVSNYLYAQRVMFDKAETFSDVAAYVAKTDPYLDENNRFPFSNAASFYVMAESAKAKSRALEDLSQRAALWFFFSSRCPKFCAIQYETVKAVAQKRGFLVKYVSLDNVPLQGMTDYVADEGQFAKLGLSLTPSIVMVSPPNTMAIVAQGALAQSELEDRILLAANHSKLLSAEVAREINPFERGRLQADDLADLKKRGIDPDDPKSWVSYLRQTLKGRY